MSALPTVRIAEPIDENEVMEMCRRLHSENGIFTLDETKVRKLLQRCFKREGVIVGVIGSPGHIEASTCLGVGDFYYTGDWHLEEFWNFVDEPFRVGTGNADALIEFGKNCADKMQIPLFTGPITSKQMAGKVRLYRRRLGPPMGAYFLYGGNLSLPRPEPIHDSHSELRKRISEFLVNYSDRSIPRSIAKEKLTPLLKEINALLKEDDFWSSGGAKNGSG